MDKKVIKYTYTKKRSEFGKWCDFSNCNKLEVDIKPDKNLEQNFIRINPVSQGTQFSKAFSANEVNTVTATYKDGGIYHYEGGWPKDININDTEQTIRYRRKIEKDEVYVHTMLQLLPSMEHCIMQNNACNIYEQYFDDEEATTLTQDVFSRTVNVYRDPSPMKRPISHLSWSPDQGVRLAVNYCSLGFVKERSVGSSCHIWNTENPNAPFLSLKACCSVMTTEFNVKDSNILAGGLTTGQVTFWDVRKGPDPVETSPLENSHKDFCDNILWLSSKSGTEMFSSSKDGQIKWWDTRKLQIPTETLVMDLVKSEEQEISRAVGISALQFEPSISTRFMCGLENGMVVSGNRKGKTPGEKIATRFKTQHGPVIALERNPTFVKNFLTVGDFSARIWYEDCRESCIMWTPANKDMLTDGAWSTTRFSVFFLTKLNGTLDVWDLLVQQDFPVLSVKVCDKALTCVKSHEQGQLVAVGSNNGATYLLELSEALSSIKKNDKLLFTALLDRETRRERVIEAKNREIRLKMKSGRAEVEPTFADAKSKDGRVSGDKNTSLIAQYTQDYKNALDKVKEK